jgi:hypothetical protein
MPPDADRHQDGGILIGKVCGHLSNEHVQRQAQRTDFGGDAAKLDEKAAKTQPGKIS